MKSKAPVGAVFFHFKKRFKENINGAMSDAMLLSYVELPLNKRIEL